MNFLGWLAGTVFSKMICPGTFALSPGSPFPFFLSSPLSSFQASPPSSSARSFAAGSTLPQSAGSHFCLLGHPPLTAAALLPSPSQPQDCANRLFPFVLHWFIKNLVPLVNRECPRACTWTRALRSAPSRVVCMMNYETLFRTSLESLVLPGHWTNEWEHVWQIRKSFLGNAREEKPAVDYCDRLRTRWRPFKGWPENKLLLTYGLNLGIA